MQVCCSSVSSQMIVASEDLSTKRKRYITTYHTYILCILPCHLVAIHIFLHDDVENLESRAE